MQDTCVQSHVIDEIALWQCAPYCEEGEQGQKGEKGEQGGRGEQGEPGQKGNHGGEKEQKGADGVTGEALHFAQATGSERA